METKENSTGESLGQVQPEGAVQQGGTRLRQALVSTKRENKALAAENAALKEEMARKELIWEQEKQRMKDEIESLVSTLFMARNDMDNMVKGLESARAKQRLFDKDRRQMAKSLVEKEKEVLSLKEHLCLQQSETEKAKQQWKSECEKVHEMERSFKQTIADCNAEWERRWSVRQEEVAAEFKSLQEESQTMRNVIQEKDDVITSARTEMAALVQRNLDDLAKLKTTEAQIQQNETQWQTKYKALEDRLKCELAEKEDSSKRTEEQQKQSKETEEKWLSKEQDWVNKANKMEEDMKLPILQSIKLQELALKTDREKAKMEKEEKKEKKEAEQRLKKEMKEKKEMKKRERKVKRTRN